MAKAGRPKIVFDSDMISKVEGLATVLSIEQIADYFGIGKNTFYRAMDRQPEILERYKKGKSKAIATVANGLLKQARSGNLTAAMFYLKTQANWKETQVLENKDAGSVNIKISKDDKK